MTPADIPQAMAQAVEESSPPGEPIPMPADLWARIAAAVQVEAARSANDKALNPDSTLLRPDPILAPRKRTARHEREDFDLSSPGRLMILIALAVVLGVAATIWISTRPGPSAAQRKASTPETLPALGPPTSVPATLTRDIP
jgi:hypothetical protein